MSATYTLKVDGMSCNHCVMSVTKALEEVEGVKKAKVDLKKGTAQVKGEEGISNDTLISAVKEAGFEAAQV
jgi:copper ion binding protein